MEIANAMKSNTNRTTSAFGILALLALTHHASAQDFFFPNDATINYVVPGTAFVGYADLTGLNTSTNGTSPTVSLVTGGDIQVNLGVTNSSIVNITGGSVGKNLSIGDESTVNLSGGNIGGSISTFQNSTLNLSGGSIASPNLLIKGHSSLHLFGIGLTDTLDGLSGPYTHYTLSGQLSDGSDVTGKNLYVATAMGASFTITNAAVPEPGSIALLVGLASVGASLLRRRRRM